VCYSLWYNAPTMLPAGTLPGYRPAKSWVHYTTSCNTKSSAPEDGRNYRPKHVELIGINNKPLLLNLDSFLYYLSAASKFIHITAALLFNSYECNICPFFYSACSKVHTHALLCY
jgi:hypothetical protein